MSLPQVTVSATAGEAPTVTVDGVLLPAVRSAQVTVSKDNIPQVSLVLAADTVELDLPAGVTVLRAGSSAAEFADRLDPRRLERDALDGLDDHGTQGEAFAAAVRAQAEDFDDR